MARDRGVTDGLPERSVGIRGRTRAKIGNSFPVRRRPGLLEGSGRAVGRDGIDGSSSPPAGPVSGSRTSRKGRVAGDATGGRLQGAPHRGRRGSRGTRRRARKGVSPVMGGPERVHGSEARARLGLGSGARGIRGSDVLGDGVERPRVAGLLPAGGTRGLDRTRGRARVRSRSTGGRLGFKAARRPSAKRGHPQGGRKSPRSACTPVRQASRGVREPFVPPGQRHSASWTLAPLSF